MSDRAESGLTALFIAELNERLFVHFTGGRWCAPLSDRLCPVLPFDGDRMGRIACADEADIQRALAGIGAGTVSGDLGSAYQGIRAPLRALRKLEGHDDPVSSPALCGPMPGDGPVILFSAAAVPVSVLAGVLIAAAPRGVIWKPAPRAAASAHFLMRVLGPLAGGRLALLQGDHASGAALAGQGALVWASDAPPPEGLDPALTLSARFRPRP